jgi:hypothetical protein
VTTDKTKWRDPTDGDPDWEGPLWSVEFSEELISTNTPLEAAKTALAHIQKHPWCVVCHCPTGLRFFVDLSDGDWSEIGRLDQEYPLPDGPSSPWPRGQVPV